MVGAEDKFRILGFAGSLRQDSYNKMLLRTGVALASEGTEIELFDLEGIPPFNQDLEGDPPDKVRNFKQKIRAADALLIATPEYNYSIPGVLKNAIDWASRPYGDNAFDEKTVAIMGASVGLLGTARAQYHLRQCCVFLRMHPVVDVEVMVPSVADKVDEKGQLKDETSRKLIRELLESLIRWTKRLKLEK
jgi:chromate reductase, NAD(P)H dehydrogenase (quinone)